MVLRLGRNRRRFLSGGVDAGHIFLAVLLFISARVDLIMQPMPKMMEPDTAPLLPPTVPMPTRNKTTILPNEVKPKVPESSPPPSIEPPIEDLPEGAIDCHALLLGGRNETVEDPNKGQLISRFTKLYPQFWVSLHIEEYDPVRWPTLHWGKYYEKALSKAFTEVLEENEGGHVIDVGGNIGWFSLLSRAMGHTVDMFEPHPSNILRFCESMCLNGWHDCNTVHPMLGATTLQNNNNEKNAYVHVHPIGLLDQPGTLVLASDGLSPGQGRLQTTSVMANAMKVSVSTLDTMGERLGWFDKDIAILKVDVEGRESEVFNGAEKLIRSGRIQNIFMEGNVFRKRMPKFLKTGQFLD